MAALENSCEGRRSAHRMQGARPVPLLNVWLIFILVLSALIVIGDGFTRESLVGIEEIAGEPLEYEPYRAAFLFGLVTLPLCLLYAQESRTSLREGILLWFLLCTVTYTKDFSYLRWPGLPLFVTDIVLLVLLLSLFGWRPLRGIDFKSKPIRLLTVFFLVGVGFFVGGLRSGREPLFVARDFALVFYSLFFLVGLYAFQSWSSIKRFLAFFALGASLATLNALAWFLAQPGQRRYIYYGAFVMMAAVGSLVATVYRLVPPGLGWILTGLLTIGVLLCNSRAVYLGVAAAVGLLLLTNAPRHSRPLSQRLKALLLGLGVVALALLVVLQTDGGRAFARRSLEELISGTVGYEEDPTGQGRLLAWLEALRRFSESPLFGEGYGLFFEVWGQTDPRPHNTYLTVLYKMGLTGFLALLLILVRFWKDCWRAIRLAGSRRRSQASPLNVLFLAQVAICVMGFFTFVLESPFTASVFWMTMGLAYRIGQSVRSPGQSRGLNSQAHVLATT